MRIRTFFAIRIADAVVKQLSGHADGLCEYDRKLQVDWVDSDYYHLTLCFLGDTGLDQVDQLELLAKEALADATSFQVKLEKIDYYELSPRLSLIAALAAENEQLLTLQKTVADLVEKARIRKDPGRFKPHVTLGKLPHKNKFKHPDEWPLLDLFSLADAVVLFQSKQGEYGSVYTPLFEVKLQDLS